MGATVAVIWVIGLIASLIVHRARAGIPFFARMKIFSRQLPWIMVHAVKSIFWPVVLIVWFLRGRPGPRVVFGKKADQLLARQRELASGAVAGGADGN